MNIKHGVRPLKRNKRLVVSSTSICFIILLILFVRRSLYLSSFKLYSSYPSHAERLKFVHLDLKGAPPKTAYLQRLFPLIAQLGATGLLIEYEDMFPYTGDPLQSIPASNSYTEKNIETILRAANEANLLVIPLVQTFGHLEYILKLVEFKDLREVAEFPQTLCPSNTKSLDVIKEMISQIVEKHPNMTHIHIGADEVEHIGMCEKCRNLLNERSWSKHELFLHHILNVVSYIRENYPHLRILMWDDKLRSIPPIILKNSPIIDVIEPVVWNYEQKVGTKMNAIFWQNYAMFPKIWAASAFKGASASNHYFLEPSTHVENQRSWLHVMDANRRKINFQGIFLTGWQRYDHFAILCELLPVAIPSLATSLKVLNGQEVSYDVAPTDLATILNCEHPLGLLNIKYGSPRCLYPGGDVYEQMFRFHHLKKHYSEIMDKSAIKGWLNEYNIKNEFSSPQIVQTSTSTLPTIKVLLEQVKLDTIIALDEVYDNYTVFEWCETYMDPLIKDVSYFVESRELLLSKNVWPKRPLQRNAHADVEFYPNVI